MGIKTPPYKNYVLWTESRFWSFIRSALRSAWSRYPVKYEALKKACVGTLLNPRSGRMAKMYLCTDCMLIFPAKEVEVDHIKNNPPLKCYNDLPAYVESLFCSEKELQVLCKGCHKAKTKRERANAS